MPFQTLRVIQGHQTGESAVPWGQMTSILPWLLLHRGGWGHGWVSLQVSTLVGEHCKGCQQKIIKTTKNKVQGSQVNSCIGT